MANSASRLADTFRDWWTDEWRVESGMFLRDRGLSKVFSLLGLEVLVKGQDAERAALKARTGALELFTQTLPAIDEMEARGLHTEAIRQSQWKWNAAILNFPRAWAASRPVNDADLMALNMVSNDLDSRKTNVDRARLNEILDLLDRVEQLLREDGSITDQLRWYVHRLVREARDRVADEDGGFTTNLHETLEALWVAMEAGRSQSKEKRGLWDKLSERLYYPVASGLIASVPSLAISVLSIPHGGHP